MPDLAHPEVTLVAATEFQRDAAAAVMAGFNPLDAAGGSATAEAAGRACYQAFGRKNPATATNVGYLRHIIEVGHLSVLEHGTATVYVTGLSRACTHEIIRHRHLSPSQLSQRFVPEGEAAMTIPDVIEADPELAETFATAADAALVAYNQLLDGLTAKYGSDTTAAKKLARQAARSILPNATETRIVLTGNYRAWRHFLNLRATSDADREIRAVAVAVLRALQDHPGSAPAFADYRIERYQDHPDAPETEIAWPELDDSGERARPGGACPNCSVEHELEWRDDHTDIVTCGNCTWEGWQADITGAAR